MVNQQQTDKQYVSTLYGWLPLLRWDALYIGGYSGLISSLRPFGFVGYTDHFWHRMTLQGVLTTNARKNALAGLRLHGGVLTVNLAVLCRICHGLTKYTSDRCIIFCLRLKLEVP